MKFKLPTAKQRQYLYSVSTAAAPLLVVGGLTSSGTASLVLTLIGAVLGLTATGTAAVATKTLRSNGTLPD